MKARIHLSLYTLLLALFFTACHTTQTSTEEKVFSTIDQQLQGMTTQLGDSPINPRCTNDDGSLRLVKSRDWTSGFFPGVLWMQYEYTQDTKWKDLAEKYTANIEDQKFNGKTHDMGFKMFCSYGNGYRLTNDSAYKEILIQSANTLMTRYNPAVGCLRSWDHNKDKWDFPVIIDNMINLELLFWASRETKDSSYYKVAYQHALTTLNNHFRVDNSCYHVVGYAPETGEVIKKNTHQGLHHESSWARGQGWALYGFTMAYRETGDERFLQQATKVADFLMNHKNLPQDGIPYWDFDDPNIPNAPRDASAAAVIASGLYEMCLYLEANAKKTTYKAFADKIINTLSSTEYLAKVGENNHFILKHSTGNMPKQDEVDQPIVYADYYYLEALLRRIKTETERDSKKSKVILKLDDVRYNKASTLDSRWKKTFKYAIDNQIKINAGVIANSLEFGSPDYIALLKKYQESEYIEFWNHGIDHKRYDKDGTSTYEFSGSGYEHQYQHIRQSQELSEVKLGKCFTTFGAPYNKTDTDTQKALDQFPELRVWLFPSTPHSATSSRICLDRIQALNIEYPVHHPVLYHLWNNLLFHEGEDVIVLQGHPRSWNDKRFSQFEMIVDYLKANNYELVLCSDL